MAALNQRRLELIEKLRAAGQRADVAALTDALVRPIAEHVLDNRGRSAYARFGYPRRDPDRSRRLLSQISPTGRLPSAPRDASLTRAAPTCRSASACYRAAPPFCFLSATGHCGCTITGMRRPGKQSVPRADRTADVGHALEHGAAHGGPESRHGRQSRDCRDQYDLFRLTV